MYNLLNHYYYNIIHYNNDFSTLFFYFIVFYNCFFLIVFFYSIFNYSFKFFVQLFFSIHLLFKCSYVFKTFKSLAFSNCVSHDCFCDIIVCNTIVKFEWHVLQWVQSIWSILRKSTASFPMNNDSVIGSYKWKPFPYYR